MIHKELVYQRVENRTRTPLVIWYRMNHGWKTSILFMSLSVNSHGLVARS
ncbi:Os04g0499150 [Oryza sativa Japonica Group]|uniref:Os04g0499150 protein n=1 Tax=Oryza sativa subsp. japonica TaxID=39947 RepID=Q6AUP6_ORYSJ|nr:unknown protein [Oryza sativa Japonica Group]BAH92728.1 Os04g0499150 [Oryza sativa Japonica Group]|eukprot:NP_001174000.1 Os04g0499150 [Oryza sativa Japonica Group]